MKKIIFLLSLAYLFFLVEYALFNLFGPWAKPDLLLLLIIFTNLFWGIRYSIFVAFCAGFIKDCFSLETFGTEIFCYIVCAYLLTYLSKTVYQRGSKFLRVLLVAVISVAHVLLLAVFYQMKHQWDGSGILFYIMLPEVVLTTLVATYVFEKLKQWAYRFV